MIKICFDRTLVVADVFADFAPHLKERFRTFYDLLFS